MSTTTEPEKKREIKKHELIGVFGIMIMAIFMIFRVMDNVKHPSTVQSILLTNNGLQKLDAAYTEGGYPAVQSKVAQLYSYLTLSRNLIVRSNGNTVMTFSDQGFSMDGTSEGCKALINYIETNKFHNNITLYADNNKVITHFECPSQSGSYMLKISFDK